MADPKDSRQFYDQVVTVHHDPSDTSLVPPKALPKLDVAQNSQAVVPSSVLFLPGLVQIALCILDQLDPMLIADPEFVLGRSYPQEYPKVIDLSPYRGYLLGVSRQHVMISQTSSGYLIKDLGSANGTWINGVRMSAFVPHPLRDGDQIQLGRLLMLVQLVFEEDSSPH